MTSTLPPPPDPFVTDDAATRNRFIRERLNFQLFAMGRTTQMGAFLAAVLLWSIFFLLTLAWMSLQYPRRRAAGL